MRVRAAGLNGADMLQRKGAYPRLPARRGHPRAGVRRRGRRPSGPARTRFEEGERVMAIAAAVARRELAVVHERQADAGARGLDWPAAGGLPEVFVTAHDALFARRACARASGCSCTAAQAA